MLNDALKASLDKINQRQGRICFLTGAGVSAESGIRTFRGKDGYWTVGSDVYTPQEMATNRMFRRSPEECWKWYLKRFLICRDVAPNAGHLAIAKAEEKLGERFALVTQNIDGLHLRAGSTIDRCFQIHGSINHMRCSIECSDELFTLPEKCAKINESDEFDSIRHVLICPDCGSMSRPHVLWFDECYDEVHYRADSAVRAAQKSDLLVVAGTTLMTNLPLMIMEHFYYHNKPIINIDIEEGNASEIAKASVGGGFIQSSSTDALPRLVELFY
jgi:NAD-dependent deacetylase